MRGQMKAISYYSDFVVFPIVLPVLLLLAHRYGGEIRLADATTAMFFGIFVWTFLEYAIHRFVLHSGLIFSKDHDAHHATPKALIGAPTWLTLSILVFGIYLPAVLMLHAGLGLIFSFGVTLGYLVYSFAHYSLHQLNVGDEGLLYRWRRLHALHHFAASEGNFGVTSSFWDHVFGTVVRRKRGRVLRNG
jgi:sterol desaturase/sphingolipid hydroxylase (fatty acid hydroxylase superfamily)